MHILIVEDEQRLAKAIKQILEKQKYMVDVVCDGNDGFKHGMYNIYDLIILDIMLPGKDGYAVAKELRKNGVNTPVLMLTAKSMVHDKVEGLDSGADDYMTKPFSTDELLARVRALSRRSAEYVSDEISIGNFTYNSSLSLLKCKNKEIHLNFKESEILKLLLSYKGRILSKEVIITKVWGYDSDACDSNVEAYISFLRRKFEFVGTELTISSIKKQGYRLEIKEQ